MLRIPACMYTCVRHLGVWCLRRLNESFWSPGTLELQSDLSAGYWICPWVSPASTPNISNLNPHASSSDTVFPSPSHMSVPTYLSVFQNCVSLKVNLTLLFLSNLQGRAQWSHLFLGPFSIPADTKHVFILAPAVVWAGHLIGCGYCHAELVYEPVFMLANVFPSD